MMKQKNRVCVRVPAVLALSLVTTLGAGCMAAEDAAAATEADVLAAPVAQAAAVGGATYQVPVDASLAGFNQYAVGHVKWEVKKGVRVLEYNLPQELVGTNQKVQLTGPDAASDWMLTGAVGTAMCNAQAGQIQCMEVLPGVSVDVPAVQSMVSKGQLAAQNLAVTKVFVGDPLGILTFKPR
jgi:hypothetical protein